MHLCSARNRRTTNALGDDDDDSLGLGDSAPTERSVGTANDRRGLTMPGHRRWWWSWYYSDAAVSASAPQWHWRTSSHPYTPESCRLGNTASRTKDPFPL